MQSFRIHIHQRVGVAILVEVPGEGGGIVDVLVAVRAQETATVGVVIAVDQVIVACLGVKLTPQPTQALRSATVALVSLFPKWIVREQRERTTTRTYTRTYTILVISYYRVGVWRGRTG